MKRLRDPDTFGGKCGLCDYTTLCGGSRARAYGFSGDPFAADPCGGTCRFKPQCGGNFRVRAHVATGDPWEADRPVTSATRKSHNPRGLRCDGCDGPGRMGPNAISRTIDALRARFGDLETEGVLRAAGLAAYVRDPPAAMVPEFEVAVLFRTLQQQLGEAHASAVARCAQLILCLLPPSFACRGLCAAIGRNTWTFAGSGSVRLTAGRPALVVIGDCPVCSETRPSDPACGFYAGAFERLFDVLVKAGARAEEMSCCAMGENACRLILTY